MSLILATFQWTSQADLKCGAAAKTFVRSQELRHVLRTLAHD